MLRRTRADQVVPVFNEFLRRFPNLQAAATAGPEEVRELLYPLGLAWRAESIVDFLHEAHQRFRDDLPQEVEMLRTLPGVGDYVAASVACFAAGKPEPLIDTNVVRVLGRIFDLRTEGEARRRSEMRRLAWRAVDTRRPSDYHYALLDFAAKVCVARSPRCEVCPFAQKGLCAYVARKMKISGSMEDGLPHQEDAPDV